MDMVNYITYLSGTEIDYSYMPFDPYNYPNPTEGQTIVIVNQITLEGDEGVALFKGCLNTTIDHLDWIDTSQATDFMDMFANSIHLQEVDLSTWNTSNVTRTTNMFYGCNFVEKINLIGWDVSNLESCTDMFNSCSQLIEIDVTDDSDWLTDAPNLSDSGGMFSDCWRLPNFYQYITDASRANTSGGYFTGIWNWSKTAYGTYEKVNDDWEEIQVYIKDGSWQKTEVYR